MAKKKTIEWTKWEESEQTARGFDATVFNSRYVVNVKQFRNGIIWLSIKRRKKETVHDWRELWRIKNELIGPNREAMEIYPSVERVVDTANQYHLWVMPEGCYINVGFCEPDVNNHNPKYPDSRQRPLPNWMKDHITEVTDKETCPIARGDDKEIPTILIKPTK
jgi:hypothetical protein